MSVNSLGRVVGGGMPVGKAGDAWKSTGPQRNWASVFTEEWRRSRSVWQMRSRRRKRRADMILDIVTMIILSIIAGFGFFTGGFALWCIVWAVMKIAG